MEETQKLWDFISSSYDPQESSAVAAGGRTCRFVYLVFSYLTKKILRATQCFPLSLFSSLLLFTGSFHVGDYGTLLKRFCEGERQCYLKLMEDTLRPFVPAYYGVVQRDEQDYNMMDNLLTHFNTPAIMDCKMGSR